MNIMDNKPIYTLLKPVMAPYRDYVKLYFNLSKVSNIIVIVLTFLIILSNIVFNLIAPSIYTIILYVLVGILTILILLSILLLPYIQIRKYKKSEISDTIDFYNDYLVVKYKKEDKEVSYKFIYDKLKKKKQTKKSYLLYIDKLGIVLSKDNNFPKEVKESLENLFSKTK